MSDFERLAIVTFQMISKPAGLGEGIGSMPPRGLGHMPRLESYPEPH